MIVKVCGMRDPENIREIEQTGIDWMGFIFCASSPRFVSEIPGHLPRKVKRVGVFVNEGIEDILAVAARFELDYAQLHGTELPDFCRSLETRGLATIKAFPIAAAGDFQATVRYSGCCSYFLFDTQSPVYGGSGLKFDWRLLDHYSGDTPFLLSGGIGLDDVEKLRGIGNRRLAGFDLNSRFESAPGMKRADLIRKFVEQIKNTEYESHQ